MEVKKHKKLDSNSLLILVLVVIWFILSILSKGTFVAPRNMATLFLQTSVLGFFVVGVNVVIILGGIDLSLSSVVVVLSAIAATLNYKMGVSPITTLLVMLLAALAIASFNGFVVAKFGIPAFIVTLAAKMYLEGISLTITNSKEMAPVDPLIRGFATNWLKKEISLPLLGVLFVAYTVWSFYQNYKAKKDGLEFDSNRKILLSLIPVIILFAGVAYISLYKGLPVMFIVLAIYAGFIHTFLTKTGYGRSIFAAGANPEAARLSGINPKHMVFLGFFLMGFSYFLGSWASMARVSGYIPGLGSGMDMDAVAACVIGGTSLMGGYGSTAGALIGALLLTCIDNGMSILNVNTFYQYIVKGLILLGAVILNQRRKV